MASDNLKTTLQRAGLTAEQFAEIIGVDPKTVQRWVAGRTPYPRHRATVARALNTTEHELWPDDVPPPSGASAPDHHAPASVGDVIGAWGQDTDPDVPDLAKFISQAGTHIDLLDDTSDLLRAPGLASALIDRATNRCQVRVLTYLPIRDLQPLIAHKHIELRLSELSPAHALIRADDTMLLSLTLAGENDQPPPLLQLHRQTTAGLFDRLARHLEELWDASDEILTNVQQLDSYLTDMEEQDNPDPVEYAVHKAPRVDEPRPAEEQGLQATEPDARPRRWPRRPQ